MTYELLLIAQSDLRLLAEHHAQDSDKLGEAARRILAALPTDAPR